jgi:hypothetical protein
LGAELAVPNGTTLILVLLEIDSQVSTTKARAMASPKDLDMARAKASFHEKDLDDPKTLARRANPGKEVANGACGLTLWRQAL